METWVLANQKGGVGKTTTTITMGALLASRGKRALLVDLDPHGSLTAYLGNDPDTVNGTVYEVFHSDRPIMENFHETRIDNLWLRVDDASKAASEPDVLRVLFVVVAT